MVLYLGPSIKEPNYFARFDINLQDIDLQNGEKIIKKHKNLQRKKSHCRRYYQAGQTYLNI